jgi:hypothetical protein
MTRATVLAMGRAAAEAGMIDACVIERSTTSETDRTTGLVVRDWFEVYNGPCRVQEVVPFVREANPSPDQKILAVARVLQLPVTSSLDIRVGDVATITASVNDPDLVGVRMIVRGQKAKSEATARRLDVEELTS